MNLPLDESEKVITVVAAEIICLWLRNNYLLFRGAVYDCIFESSYGHVSVYSNRIC